MPVARERQRFPTRSYPYRYRTADEVLADEPEPALTPGRIHAYVLGADDSARLMPDDEAGAILHDPFAELLLKRGIFPLTARALLAALDAANGDPMGLPKQTSFLVADGGQIPWSNETANVERFFRFAIVRSRDAEAELMIAASTALDSDSQFIQLIAWDPVSAAYNFYERGRGTWIWAGSSDHALGPQTRGKGPFDSHVNGGLVMKELRVPWNNWHSMDASITEAVLAPDDALRTEPIFTNRESAHVLEKSVVRPGISRWNRSRFKKAVTQDAKILQNVRHFMRQILETTTVNLATSAQRSAGIGNNEKLTLPTTFFLNSEVLIDEIGLDPDIAVIRVPGRFYNDSIRHYEFALTDGTFRVAGDTFFAFLVPEPAFEDTDVLALLLRERIISPRFAACLLMIDFPNPIFSARRGALMKYVPFTSHLSSAPGNPLRSDLEAEFVTAVKAAPAAGDDKSPEGEFLANWGVPVDKWMREFASRIEGYFAELGGKAESEIGFDGWVRLAESRRREFRRRPLAEFRLTVPITNIPPDAPTLQMRADGTVFPQTQ